jgi:hypothetical protein
VFEGHEHTIFSALGDIVDPFERAARFADLMGIHIAAARAEWQKACA